MEPPSPTPTFQDWLLEAADLLEQIARAIENKNLPRANALTKIRRAARDPNWPEPAPYLARYETFVRYEHGLGEELGQVNYSEIQVLSTLWRKYRDEVGVR